MDPAPEDTSDDVDEISDIGKVDEFNHPSHGIIVSIPVGTHAPTPINGSRTAFYITANQSATIQPNQSLQIDTGLRTAIPYGFSMLLTSRSRLAAQGIHLATEVIDCDYSGPIILTLHNNTSIPRRVCKGERLSVAVIIPTPSVTWESIEL